MARYIKANKKVAAYLHLENDRNMVKDGNYLLWQADMLAFGPLTQLASILEQIGGIALLPHEAREEQDGTVSRPLPTATDERFIIDTADTADADQAPTPAPASEDVSDQADDETGDTQEAAEGDQVENQEAAESEETADGDQAENQEAAGDETETENQE